MATPNPFEYGKVNTTDGNATTVWSKTLADNTVYHLFCLVAGRDNAGTTAARAVRSAFVFRQGGGIAGLDPSPTAIGQTLPGGWIVAFDVDGGNNARLRVTAQVGMTVTWKAAVAVVSVST